MIYLLQPQLHNHLQLLAIVVSLIFVWCPLAFNFLVSVVSLLNYTFMLLLVLPLVFIACLIDLPRQQRLIYIKSALVYFMLGYTFLYFLLCYAFFTVEPMVGSSAYSYAFFMVEPMIGSSGHIDYCFAGGLILSEPVRLITSEPDRLLLPTIKRGIKVGTLNSLPPILFKSYYLFYRTLFKAINDPILYETMFAFYRSNQKLYVPSFFPQQKVVKSTFKLLVKAEVQEPRVLMLGQELLTRHIHECVEVAFWLHDCLRERKGLPMSLSDDLTYFCNLCTAANLDLPLWGSPQPLGLISCLVFSAILSDAERPYVTLLNSAPSLQNLYLYADRVLDFGSGHILGPDLFNNKLNKLVRFTGQAFLFNRYKNNNLPVLDQPLYASLAAQHNLFFKFTLNEQTASRTYPLYVNATLENSWEFLPHSHEQLGWLTDQLAKHLALLGVEDLELLQRYFQRYMARLRK